MYTYKCICSVHEQMFENLYTYIHTYTHTCACVRLCICEFLLCFRNSIQSFKHVFTHATYVCTFVCVHIHTYMEKNIHSLLQKKHERASLNIANTKLGTSFTLIILYTYVCMYVHTQYIYRTCVYMYKKRPKHKE